MEKQKKNTITKGVKHILDMVLRTEANTTSSVILYQAKTPDDLKKFRRNK